MNIPVTFDWTRFKIYAEHCHVGSYQVCDTADNVHREIRVHAGKFGFKGTFEKDNPTDQQVLVDIRRFCDFNGFLQIDETVTEDDFYE